MPERAFCDVLVGRLCTRPLMRRLKALVQKKAHVATSDSARHGPTNAERRPRAVGVSDSKARSRPCQQLPYLQMLRRSGKTERQLLVTSRPTEEGHAP